MSDNKVTKIEAEKTTEIKKAEEQLPVELTDEALEDVSGGWVPRSLDVCPLCGCGFGIHFGFCPNVNNNAKVKHL